MDQDTFNIIRPKEEVAERRIPNIKFRDLSNATLLSSLIFSYDIKPSEDAKDLFVKHHQPYAMRYQVIPSFSNMLYF